MNKQVILTKKNVYGTELIYPVNYIAVIFINLTGRKTFKNDDLGLIKALGYEIIYQ